MLQVFPYAVTHNAKIKLNSWGYCGCLFKLENEETKDSIYLYHIPVNCGHFISHYYIFYSRVLLVFIAGIYVYF